MPNLVRFKVTITASGHGGDMPGFLDMMRYEGGTIISWDHNADGRFTVEVLVPSIRFQPDRWASFGIRTHVEEYVR